MAIIRANGRAANIAASPPARLRPAFIGPSLVIALALAYAGSLHGPFVFDDIQSIVENPSIRHLPSRAIWAPPAGLTVSGRPLLNASLALNWAIGGASVTGYHVLNFAIHTAAALVLFGLLRRTFASPRLSGSLGGDATTVAFGAALLWALHPLQTAAVTYVIQRAESLMGLLYLLTLYCFMRSTEEPRARKWRLACVGACLLGMAAKEVMATAPVVVLIYDRMFVARSWREIRRTRLRLHLALASTWLLLALLVWHSGDRAGTAGFSAGLTSWEYALTQCHAIVEYLRLSVWPYPLVFDRGPYASSSVREIFPAILLLATLVSAFVFWSRRQPTAGFAGAFFILTLAPSSSVIPIVTEPMAEHRLYLPLAALTTLAALGLNRIVQAHRLAMFIVVGLGLGFLTFQRNTVYRSELTLWTTTVQAAPLNPRGHYSLALALVAAGDRAAAEPHFQTAIALRPNYLGPRHGLADLLATAGRLPEAVTEYQSILQIHPADFVAHHALGMLSAQLGDLRTAAGHFENALRIRPDSAPAHNNLGSAFYEQGDLTAAKAHLDAALGLKPDYAEAHYNLGNVLTRKNALHAARDHYERALALAPDYAEAHAHLGVVLHSLGETSIAIWHYREALRLRPDFAFVQKNLAKLGPATGQQ